MAMVVRSNLNALNANRQLGMNNSQVAKSLEKLSSGFRINRAGDDASGLAISEKMKAQIKGLEQASANSQDGISLVQTAEGAMTEVHNMLNRMTELATKSANGTISDKVDREAIQREVDQLSEEIDRIGDSTNFNGINLLDGSLGGGGGAAATVAKLDGGLTVSNTAATSYKSAAALKGTSVLAKTATNGDKITMSIAYEKGGQSKNVEVNLTLGVDKDGKKVLIGDSGAEYAIAAFGTAGVATTDIDAAMKKEIDKSAAAKDFNITGDYNKTGLTFESKTAGAGGAVLSAISTSATVSGTKTSTAVALGINQANAADAYQKGKAVLYTGSNEEASVFTVNGKKYALAADGADVSKLDKNIKVIFGADLAAASGNAANTISQDTGLKVTSDGTDTLSFQAGTSATGGAGGLTLQVGDTNDTFNKVSVSVDDVRSAGLGIKGLDVSNQDAAGNSIQTIKDAINKVSTNRGNLGALQNRLEYAINNLDVTAENMSSANSRIRDTDMAKEMMNYTKMNVLTQSAQAMLAQANQAPQSILQLLQ